MKSIASGTDLNTITESGFYNFAQEGTLVNAPADGTNRLALIVQRTSNIYLAQMAIENLQNNYGVYFRRCLNGTWSSWEKLAFNSNFNRYSFNGTPDADGVIITDCPLSTHIPITAYQLNREGWIINFVQNNNKSTSYWCARISGANASSGNFSAYVAAITKSVLTI